MPRVIGRSGHWKSKSNTYRKSTRISADWENLHRGDAEARRTGEDRRDRRHRASSPESEGQNRPRRQADPENLPATNPLKAFPLDDRPETPTSLYWVKC